MSPLLACAARMLGDRRRAQSGTTLVELLVSVAIMGLALALIIGTISSGLLDATLAKRNTAVQAVMQYEMEQLSATSFSSSAASYSDCFATESPANPAAASGFRASCPSGGYTLRADVSWQWLPSSTTVQVWTVTVTTWPAGASTEAPLQIYKTTH